MSSSITGSWGKMVKSTKLSKPRAQQSRSRKVKPQELSPEQTKQAKPQELSPKRTKRPNPNNPFAKKQSAQKVPPPFKHQLETVKILLKEPATLDASDPGTAKTRGHLDAWAHRRRHGGKCLLVLAPKSILKSAWGNDIDKFLPGEFKYSIAYANNREEAFDEEADIYITNIDAAKWLSKKPAGFFKHFDEMVVDESESIKHRTSGRSKAVAKISKWFPYRRCLSGTPHSQSIQEVWHQYFVLDKGQRLGTSFFSFRMAVCEAKQNGPRPEHVKWVDKEGAEQVVAGLVKDVTIRNKFEDCHDIPPNHSYYVYFDLNKKHKQLYEQLKEESMIRLKDDTVTAVNAAVLRNKLLQLTSGASYSDNGYAEISHDRNELILELVAERDYSLVFFLWQHQKHELTKLAKSKGIEHEIIDGTVSNKRREEIVQAYQEGSFQTLLLQPQSAAHGLTLTQGRTTIWASPIAQPNIMRQGLGRIYRAGQTKKTENIMVCANDTLEKEVFKVMESRAKSMMNLLEMLE